MKKLVILSALLFSSPSFAATTNSLDGATIGTSSLSATGTPSSTTYLRGFSAEDFARTHPGGALGRRLLTRVADLMHQADDLPVVTAEASLADALREMSRTGLGITTVLDADRRLLGLFTDGDLRRALEAMPLDIRTASVRDHMTRQPITILASRPAVEAAELMQARRISAIVATDETGRVCGAFNMHDLLRAGIV